MYSGEELFVHLGFVKSSAMVGENLLAVSEGSIRFRDKGMGWRRRIHGGIVGIPITVTCVGVGTPHFLLVSQSHSASNTNLDLLVLGFLAHSSTQSLFSIRYSNNFFLSFPQTQTKKDPLFLISFLAHLSGRCKNIKP